jgi:outer membrane protein assembly factor BamA
LGRSFLIAILLLSAGRAHTADGIPRIHHIVIHGLERTDEQVIRRELLFAAGDVLDSTRVAETARNLRRLLFIGEVHIRLLDRPEGVEVTVSVEDLYSRTLSPLISGQIDELSFGAVALDYNFRGRGQRLRLGFEDRAISGPWAELLFAEPRLNGSRRALAAQLTAGAEGHAHALTFSQPFATLADRRAYGLSLFSQQAVQRLYSEGQLATRYQDALDGGRIWLTRSYGEQKKVRPSVQLQVSRRRFTASSSDGYAPSNRTRIVPSVGLLVWHPRYKRTRYIRNLGPLEDLQTGSWLSLRWGFAHRLLGSDRTFSFYQAQLAPRFEPTKRSYAELTLFTSSHRGEGKFYNLFASASATAYFRLGAAHSLALRAAWEALHRSEDADQLLLGLARGLRGYAPRRYNGTRRVLFNVEARPTLIRRPWYTLASAAFVDCGAAWTPDSKRVNLVCSPGLGTRLGWPKVYNTPVLRGDIAYGLAEGTYAFSVGMGQYF